MGWRSLFVELSTKQQSNTILLVYRNRLFHITELCYLVLLLLIGCSVDQSRRFFVNRKVDLNW